MDVSKTQALRSIISDQSLLREECYINGNWVGGDDKIDVTNPASGEVIASVPKLGAKETAEAIAAAEQAMKDWAGRTAKERANIMRAWFNLMIENTEDLLESAARTYINSPRGVRLGKNGLIVSSIYVWFQEDFGDSDDDVIAHLERYAEPETSAKIRQAGKLAGHDYDWSLNDYRHAGS